ncbi:MAG: manganese efflux pump [Leptospiraceae bacterium]|nr:manganese efflux pump [Leptospiraceae bacterium]
MSFLFALFQSGMLVIGYFAGSFSSGFLGSLARWISALLLFYRTKMLKEGFEEEYGETTVELKYIILSISTT